MPRLRRTPPFAASRARRIGRSLSALAIAVVAVIALRVDAQTVPSTARSSARTQARLSVPSTVDTLPNGLTLIVHEDHSVPTVATNVWFHVGSGDEKPGRTGFAHLFEHLMFMGSEHAEYPQFDRLLEGAGASNNVTTNNDRTAYLRMGPVERDSAHALARGRSHGVAPPDHGFRQGQRAA